MPKLISAAKQPAQAQPPMRVVLLTMDTHLSSAANRSATLLAQKLPGLQFKMHAASEYRASDEALNKCVQDIERADLVIVTMLFMEDHYLPVMDALTAKRHHCDAMVCIMSAPPVMQLTRMGKFSMGGQSSGLMSLLKKLRPKAKDTSDNKSPSKSEGAKQMAMLRRIPKLLRFIPGTAQDLRIFFLTMRYWLAGSEQNMANMVVTLVNRYADGERQSYRQVIEAQEPVEYPEVGLYHPKMKVKITDSLENLPKGLDLNAVLVELKIVPDLLIEMNRLRAPDAKVSQQSYGKIKLSRRVPIVERDLHRVTCPAVCMALDNAGPQGA